MKLLSVISNLFLAASALTASLTVVTIISGATSKERCGTTGATAILAVGAVCIATLIPAFVLHLIRARRSPSLARK